MHISGLSGYGYESGEMTVSINFTDNDTAIAITLREDEIRELQNILIKFYEARQEEVSNLVRDKPVTTQLLPAPPFQYDEDIPF
jgi:hypothetical protein